MYTFISAYLEERAISPSLDLWVTLHRVRCKKPQGRPGEISCQPKFHSEQTHYMEACTYAKINQKAVTFFIKDLERVYGICQKVVWKGLKVK